MPIPAVATWDSAAMTASVMPSTREAGRRLPAAVRRRAQAEGGADAPDRHADAFQVEVDDRRREDRQQLAQEETADDRDAERGAWAAQRPS